MKLQQLPDDEPLPEPRPGDDPMAALGSTITAVLRGPMVHARMPQAFMGSPAGFEFRKQVEITVSDFHGLAGVIAKFDNLVSDIETEKLASHS